MIHDTVIKVSESAGDQEKTQQKYRKVMTRFRHTGNHIDHRRKNNDRQHSEQPLLVLQDPESSSMVLQIMQFQHTRDQRNILPSLQMSHGKLFCPLIQPKQKYRKHNADKIKHTGISFTLHRSGLR